MKQDLPSENQPLLLKSKNDQITLITPENIDERAVINLLPSEKLLVVCSGKSNMIVEVANHESSGFCSTQNKILFENAKSVKLVDVKDMKCKKQITAETQETNKICGPQNVGKIYNIGFEVCIVEVFSFNN